MENYEIKHNHKLGSGASGVTYKVINKETKEELAMKCIRRGDIDAEYVEREIMNHRVLQHPNIIQFREVVLDDKMLGIVMELAEGGELLDDVLTGGVYTEAKAGKLFQQLIAGLFYVHSKRICHRDLKPKNILLNSNGVLKICDFGLSKSSEIQSRAKTNAGTQGYKAPEVEYLKSQSRTTYEGKFADVWSCGVTLYKMLTSKRLDSARPDQCIKSLNVSDDCKDLLGQMLLADPNKRIKVKNIMLHKWYLTHLPRDFEEAQAAIRSNPNVTPLYQCQTKEDILKILAEIRKSDLDLETVDEAAEISIAAQEDKDIADMENGI